MPAAENGLRRVKRCGWPGITDPQYARFDSAGLRRGYDPKEVDDFLDEIAHMQPEG